MTTAAGIETTREDAALAALMEERASLSDWERRRDNASAAHHSLIQRAGADLLAEPDALVNVAGELARLQAEVEMAERAIAAQRPRVIDAERRYLEVELDLERAMLARDRKDLEEHEAKTARLLARLEAHEGKYIALSDHQDQLNSGRDNWYDLLPIAPMKSVLLRGQVEQSQRRVEVLELLVTGHDPRPLLQSWRDPFAAEGVSYLPAAVEGPDAVVPLQDYLDACSE